ncbi:hypothetical protein DL93DRAFT_767510 [Clavulina sp. PMI_390]|nr:hypothetical protein DL93DRAFT_767510 [Clavulina sp. PMI_390]
MPQIMPPPTAEVYHSQVLVYPIDDLSVRCFSSLREHFLTNPSYSRTVALGFESRTRNIHLPPAALVNTSSLRKITVWATGDQLSGVLPVNTTFAESGSLDEKRPTARITTLPSDLLLSQSRTWTRSTSSNPSSRSAGSVREMSTSHVSVAKCVASGQHLLSLVCSKGHRDVGMALSKQINDSVIVHRPIVLCVEGEGVVRPLRWASRQWVGIGYLWSDHAGRVVILAGEPRDQTKCTIQVYDI